MKKLIALFIFFLAGSANATLINSSTGDLGNNVINDSGSFEVFLNATTPSNSLAADIKIKYGLYNSPSVDVSVFFNDNLVGNFLADNSYISPGPEFISFDITGLLMNGSNKISFNGSGANNGDYIVGQVDINYDNSGTSSVPEPSSIALLFLGLAGVGFSRKKKTS
ncbi:MAG: PEP-CTERM sorting domain-containing protein [Candidatus Brocadiaceae bacterium]|nr:PEP-CTERM sorting domain-containing protein [Candidatus Brocadiaceae bacterium]